MGNRSDPPPSKIAHVDRFPTKKRNFLPVCDSKLSKHRAVSLLHSWATCRFRSNANSCRLVASVIVAFAKNADFYRGVLITFNYVSDAAFSDFMPLCRSYYCVVFCCVVCCIVCRNEWTNDIATVLNWSGFITVLISMLCCKLWRFTVYFLRCVLKQHLFHVARNLSACVSFLSCVCESFWSCTLNTCNKMFSIQRPITEPPPSLK